MGDVVTVCMTLSTVPTVQDLEHNTVILFIFTITGVANHT